MAESYNLLIERISSSSGISKEEIEKKIDEKRTKLSGLISKEGAAQIIATELGVKFEGVTLKISELSAGMRRVNTIGKIATLFPVRSFDKNGRSGKVSNFVIADETGNSKVVLWDANHISMVEKEEIKQGDVVEIINATVREGEIHLNSFSELKKSSSTINGVLKTERFFNEKNIESIQEGNSVSVRGSIVQMFSPRFFSVCSQCGKKVITNTEGFFCNEHKKVIPSERALLNFILDDGTDSIRVVLFSDQLEKLISLERLKDGAEFLKFKEDLLGSEVFVKGLVRKNSLFGNLEITGSDLKKCNVVELIASLEN